MSIAHRETEGEGERRRGHALQKRLTTPTKTNRNWGGTSAKLRTCAGAKTALERGISMCVVVRGEAGRGETGRD